MSADVERTAGRKRPIRLGEVVVGGSWLALVAETTPGMGRMACERVRVRGVGVEGDRSLRLVVQSYACSDVGLDGMPLPSARPIGSTQWGTNAAQLRRGIEVSLVHLSEESAAMVVAWIEVGDGDLEFDARRARPDGASLVGVACSSRGDRAEVVLRRIERHASDRAAASAA